MLTNDGDLYCQVHDCHIDDVLGNIYRTQFKKICHIKQNKLLNNRLRYSNIQMALRNIVPIGITILVHTIYYSYLLLSIGQRVVSILLSTTVL